MSASGGKNGDVLLAVTIHQSAMSATGSHSAVAIRETLRSRFAAGAGRRRAVGTTLVVTGSCPDDLVRCADVPLRLVPVHDFALHEEEGAVSTIPSRPATMM